MGKAITHEQIVSSLSNYLDVNLTVSTQVQYPGETINNESNDDWIEVWVSNFKRDKQRKTNKDRRTGIIKINCFAKLTTSRYRIWDIAKDVADTLEHSVISLQDFNTVGEPAVGFLEIFEPQRSDSTRTFNKRINAHVSVIEIQFPCRAQED